ncbi:MAG: phage minor tail protein L [Betaproteobacteria bacterium]|nr:phage minor tail protein L [Betaproteobacteria bacterium]
MSNFEGGGIARFHAGTNGLQQPVWWQGVEYLPLPIEAEGFDIMTKGQLPRPKVRVANIGGLFSAEARQHDDLIGCKVTRKRTFMRYLDAKNFPGGVNADADPNQCLPDDIWFVDRKSIENRYVIEWELASAFDVQGVMLPFRQIIQNSCPWKYRGAECGWVGGYYDRDDKATYESGKDYCAKRLSSCRIRFGVTVDLPFGGYPGAHRFDG